jgi:transcriptional regulator with XRE-family HTH domain
VNEFARRLKELREARGWTWYRLAKESGISTDGIAKMERPGTDPKLSTLHKLAAAFGIDVAELLAGVEAKGQARKKRPGKA